VLVNLPSLGDEALADQMLGRVETLLAEIEDLAEATRAHVERRELRDPEPDLAEAAGYAAGDSGAGTLAAGTPAAGDTGAGA
jgi:hypothetical protein